MENALDLVQDHCLVSYDGERLDGLQTNAKRRVFKAGSVCGEEFSVDGVSGEGGFARPDSVNAHPFRVVAEGPGDSGGVERRPSFQGPEGVQGFELVPSADRFPEGFHRLGAQVFPVDKQALGGVAYPAILAAQRSDKFDVGSFR